MNHAFVFGGGAARAAIGPWGENQECSFSSLRAEERTHGAHLTTTTSCRGRGVAALARAIPSWALGVAVATPVVAILQGALLLYDYRLHHAEAPRPEVPARGVVILQGDAPPLEPSAPPSEGLWRRMRGDGVRLLRRPTVSSRPPLRLLVIGDSLAAGVGTSHSDSPALPRSVAQALSRSLGGLPVYWTCVGTPGWSATEVAQGIHLLPDLPTPIVRRLAEWRDEQHRKARHRLGSATDRARHWIGELGTPAKDPDDDDGRTAQSEEGDGSSQPALWALRRRLGRARLGVQRDWRNFRHIFGPPNGDGASGDNIEEDEDAAFGRFPAAVEDDDDDDERERSPHVNGHHQRHVERRVRRMVRRNRLDPSFVNQYDVAVVLTGLNDLKDAWLPWTVSAQRAQSRAEAQRQDGSSGGIGDELLRIVRALKATVLAPLEGADSAATTETTKTSTTAREPPPPEGGVVRVPQVERRPSLSRKGPLIVFPALPMEPIELNHRAPLSWFVAPLVRAMDRNKQLLAERYPELVLFVPSPPSTVFSDAEARRGPLWDGFLKEAVLLSLTELVHTVHDRLDELRHRPYRPGWALESTDAGLVGDDVGESSELYTLEGDDVVLVPNRSQAVRRPGASMVSPDGIHPNDQGYDLWGKFIAEAILEHWERERVATANL